MDKKARASRLTKRLDHSVPDFTLERKMKAEATATKEPASKES
jgi:hypothetical protein